MTTANHLDDIYRSRYSSDHGLALDILEDGAYRRVLGQLVQNIITSQLEIVPDDQADPDPIAAMCDIDRITETEVAQGIDKALRAEIERLFFSHISRPDALAILNSMALVPLATLEISHGMSYTALMVKDAWNRHNPEDRPIEINPSYLP